MLKLRFVRFTRLFSQDSAIFPTELPFPIAQPFPTELVEDDKDFTTTFKGVSAQPVSDKAWTVLAAQINNDDVEVKPDGLLYLPEIKYRRILNKAFGPGGWGLVPRLIMYNLVVLIL
jgi:hypothetical protein